LMAGVKKGVQFSPMKKKKSPSKTKRGVRWRDDTENGTLAEFQQTPEHLAGTPTQSATGVSPPKFTTSIPIPTYDGSGGSSPIPTPPKASVDLKGSSRFAVGALSKRSDGSPTSRSNNAYASDSDNASPLRDIYNNPRTSSLSTVENASSGPAPEGNSGQSSSEEEKWTESDARQIGHAIKRRSSTNGSVPVNRAHRRRSPTAATVGSPPNENSLLSAGAARRMVKSNHDADWKNSVLSPRVTPIMKGAVRRTTLANVGDDRPREAPPNLNARAPVRILSGSSSRGSLMPNSKSVWR
jgi:kinesin family protein 18/19